jgi:thiosulfate dehydrogenase
MRTSLKISFAAMAILATAGGVAVAQNRTTNPVHDVPPVSANGNLVVGLCDGKTTAEVPGVKPGQALTRTQAQDVSDRLMNEWKAKNPGALWDKTDEAPKVAQNTVPPPPPASRPQPPEGPAASNGGKQEAHTYGSYTKRDEEIWKASTDAFIEQGRQIFHDANRLGGTIAVSCDMCHPNAANTHPETYPKYQVQLGRVAMLRDMINWCIENPVRGKPLADDDPKLKAMEAYILAQRKGVALEYGKH